MSSGRKGMTGAPVKRLQAALGITDDGIFGPGTESALLTWQEEHGLAVDGVAGPDTFTAMGLHELVLLRVGSRGTTVRALQEALKIGADGIFGNGTKAAVEAFQAENGLVVDGMAGPKTLAKLEAFATTFTPETVEKAEVAPEEEDSFEVAPLPELKGGAPVETATVEEAPKKSVWGRVKGWFG